MAQADILLLLSKTIKELEKKIDNITKDEEVMDQLWKASLSRQDIINVLGISLKSVSHGLAKLHLQDQIIKLKNEQEDKRKTRYIIKDGCYNGLVNKRSDK